MNASDPHVTYVEWTDPKGNIHQPGETGDYSEVGDLDVLIRIRTVGEIPHPAVEVTADPDETIELPETWRKRKGSNA